jgi:predicted Zn-dependent peptidase
MRDAEAQVRVSWKISASTDEEAPVFAILANILVGSADARLHRRLVREERIASSVLAGTGPGSLYPGLFTIQATPRGEHTPEEVEAAIYDELERLRRVPPTEDEIARVRTGLEAARARRLTSPEGLAFQLVSSQAQFGDWRETFRFQERMQTVIAEDVVEALGRFLTESGRTVATLRPDPGA